MLEMGRGYIIAGVGREVKGLSLKEGKNMCYIYTPSIKMRVFIAAHFVV